MRVWNKKQPRKRQDEHDNLHFQNVNGTEKTTCNRYSLLPSPLYITYPAETRDSFERSPSVVFSGQRRVEEQREVLHPITQRLDDPYPLARSGRHDQRILFLSLKASGQVSTC